MAGKLTLKEFVEILQTEGNRTVKRMLRLRLMLANQIRNQTIYNIKKTFGERGDGAGKPHWPWGLPGHSGALMRSVEVFSSGDRVGVSVGGMGVPYAAIQEEGGLVLPKGKFLAVPAQPKYVGRRPREFALQFGFDPATRMFCLTPTNFAGLEITGRKRRQASKTEVAFYLISKARMPSRPYFQPAIAMVTGDPNVKALVANAFSKDVAGLAHGPLGTSLEWEVK